MRSSTQRRSARLGPARLGLSLLDVTVVVVVVSGSLGFAAYSVVGYIDSSRVETARDEVSHIRGLVDGYRAERGELPESLDDLIATLPDSAAVERSDPWHRAYRYRLAPDGSFELFSLGPDGLGGTDDDVYPFGLEWHRTRPERLE